MNAFGAIAGAFGGAVAVIVTMGITMLGLFD